MSSNSWETRDYVGGKILDLIFENWNERFATLKQEYKRKGKAAMEIKMTVELPDYRCKQMWGESDGQIEIEQGSEEDGNVHGEANTPTTQGKGQDVGNTHSEALASTAQQNRSSNVAPTARPAPNTVQNNSNRHSGAPASTSHQMFGPHQE